MCLACARCNILASVCIFLLAKIMNTVTQKKQIAILIFLVKNMKGKIKVACLVAKRVSWKHRTNFQGKRMAASQDQDQRWPQNRL